MHALQLETAATTTTHLTLGVMRKQCAAHHDRREGELVRQLYYGNVMGSPEQLSNIAVARMKNTQMSFHFIEY